MYYIENIEIEGFKSYQFKTGLLNLDKNFNIITGTNGSGKSNILDAICFVLGITNLSTIRAETLKDLIFQGKCNKKNSSSVAIFLRLNPSLNERNLNTKLDRIVISRKILKEGKNKYLFNNQIIHPSKILNFLFSINININNPHFLIKQGHIIKIAQMNPRELLDFFENTVGTKLYEKKKKLALDIVGKKNWKVEEISFLLTNKINPKLKILAQALLDRTRCDKIKKRKKELGHLKKTIMRIFQFLVQIKKVFANFFANKLFFLSKIELNIIKRLKNKIKEKKNKCMCLFFRFFGQTDPSFYQNREEISNKHILIFSRVKIFFKTDVIDLKNIYLSKNIKTYMEKNLIENIIRRNVSINIFYSKKKLKITYHLLFKILLSIKEITQKISEWFCYSNNFYRNSLFLKEKTNMTKIEYLEINVQKINLKKKTGIIFYQKNHDFIIKMKDIFSYTFEFLEPIKTSGKLNIWNLRNNIIGVIGSLVQLKNIFLTTAIDCSINNRLSFLVVSSYLFSKAILDLIDLKQKLTIIPLDKIIVIQKPYKAWQNFFRLIDYLSYDIQFCKAIKFAFGNILVVSDTIQARYFAYNYDRDIRCVTFQGDVFDSSGIIITGVLTKNQYTVYSLFGELNNEKVSCIRYGTIKYKQYIKGLKEKKRKSSYSKEYNVIFNSIIGRKLFILPFFISKKMFCIDSIFFRSVKNKKLKLEKNLIALYMNIVFKYCSKKKKDKLVIENLSRTKYNKYLQNDIEIQNRKIIDSIKLGNETLILEKIHYIIILKKYLLLQKKLALSKSILLLNINNVFNRFLFGFYSKYFENKYKQFLCLNGIISKPKFNISIKIGKNVNINQKIISYILLSLFLKIESLLKTKLFSKKIIESEKSDLEKFFRSIIHQYSYIKKKRAIIERDKLNIKEIVERLEVKKKEILLKMLKKINNIFQIIFACLIPGYYGKIVSIKSEENLLKGLNFRISSKKSEQKYVSELSGGQKSLLALSFIFCLLILKPAPFYILDEIDAALDSYHTKNIGKMIQSYFSVSQFIIITLKRGLTLNAKVVFKVKSLNGCSTIVCFRK
nr:60S ribosomal protein L7 [Cryptomonas sp.]